MLFHESYQGRLSVPFYAIKGFKIDHIMDTYPKVDIVFDRTELYKEH